MIDLGLVNDTNSNLQRISSHLSLLYTIQFKTLVVLATTIVLKWVPARQ
jgi:hypothetical protein